MTRALLWRLRALVPAVLVCTLLSSCGGGGIRLHPVKGQVFYLDKPAAGANVVFQPLGDGPAKDLRPSGKVGSDGSFTLTTHPHGPGAPAGEYVVLVTWYPPNARDVENPVNKLPGKYADATAKLLTATVKDGPTELPPFRLTK